MNNKLKKNKGITLVALIITIIILLILAVVAITSISNSNIIKHAQNVGTAYTEADEKEKVTLAVHEAMLDGQGSINKNEITNGMNAQFPNNGWKEVSSDEETMTVQILSTGRKYKITLKTGAMENITEENSGENPGETTAKIPEDFEKYIMGQDKKGRNVTGENGIFVSGEEHEPNYFIDDPLTENVDETKTLGVECLFATANGDYSKAFVYAKYDGKAYKITINNETGISEKLELIYEPKGKEGQKTADGWTILYDNGDTAEAVSPTAMGSLTLGYNEGTTDSEAKVTEAIESYNNAITAINNCCKKLEGLPTNKGIRSVGAGSETTTAKYSSDNLAKLEPKYNGVGLIGDTNYEQDLIRMTYWNVNNVGIEYWIASRLIWEYEDENGYSIEFSICCYSDNLLDYNGLYGGSQNEGVSARVISSCAVRPIITIDNK